MQKSKRHPSLAHPTPGPSHQPLFPALLSGGTSTGTCVQAGRQPLGFFCFVPFYFLDLNGVQIKRGSPVCKSLVASQSAGWRRCCHASFAKRIESSTESLGSNLRMSQGRDSWLPALSCGVRVSWAKFLIQGHRISNKELLSPRVRVFSSQTLCEDLLFRPAPFCYLFKCRPHSV